MKVIGLMIKRMDKESIFIKMVLPMKDNGKMISNMEKEKNNGQMEQSIKDNIIWGKKMAMENLIGLINLVIMEILKIIIFMEKENTYGMTEENL